MNTATCQSRCQTCRAMFTYLTTRRTLRDVCDDCIEAESQPAEAPRAQPRARTRSDESFAHVTSNHDFMLAWEMSDSMDDLLMLLPEYNDPTDNGKGRGRARIRAHVLRKDGHDLKMMGRG